MRAPEIQLVADLLGRPVVDDNGHTFYPKVPPLACRNTDCDKCRSACPTPVHLDDAINFLGGSR